MLAIHRFEPLLNLKVLSSPLLAELSLQNLLLPVVNKLLDKLLVSKVESDVTAKVSGPTIYLPEKRPEGENVDIDKIREEARAEWAKEDAAPAPAPE